MKWYAIHTFSGQESNIKKHLEMLIEREGVQDKFGRILVPQKVVQSNVRGKRKTTVQNLFPAYIIVEMELDELTQHLVTTIQGVTHFGGTSRLNKVPVPLRQSEVDRLLGVDPEDNLEGEIQIPYVVGDSVCIKEGPFKGFVGTVEEIMTDKLKLKVMVSVFGRSTPVELGFGQVETVS
ncbi:MAG: transcription termination/antitermination protein NusG [Fibrobacteraceae bacterium]|jgi:transcription termination/antitermination protein NusG|nr:MAG: transcription termination/antitermination factor NusG [Fibrobacteres bacterium CG2_30_45_31]